MPVVLMALPPHYLICLGILFPREGACMVVQRVCPEMTFLFFFFSFSFFLGLRTGHAKNHTGPSIYFFFGFSPFSLICKFFLFTLIISIRFYFLFHPCSFYF
jgi:hypothetical protein